MLKEGERIDYIPGSNYRIIQNVEKFSYGIDAVLLSEFTRAKGLVVDFGTGTGIIPMRILARQKVDKIYGVEIQQEVASMAQRSLDLNEIKDIEILTTDLKKLDQVFAKHSIDTIVSNPPYMVEEGLVNMDENFAISRHEIKCNIFDVAKMAGYLLRPLGKIFLIHRPSRLVDILVALRENKIEAKRIQYVQPREGAVANLVLIEGVKNGKRELRHEKTLNVYKSDGTYTEEIEEIYNRSWENAR